MDDRGRLARPLTRRKDSRLSAARRAKEARSVPLRRRLAAWSRGLSGTRYLGRLSGFLSVVLAFGTRRGAIALVTLLLVAGGVYGLQRGGHWRELAKLYEDTRDKLATASGFRIAAIAVTGEKEVGREEILSLAGVTGRTSLLFLDADAARRGLLTNPWIADATVLKLYPDRLQITITERKAFALWQKDGRVSVISADGVVVQPFVDSRFSRLPLVVGEGAEREAADFLALLDRYPEIRKEVRASILVAERRWNLKLKNDVDVRLPEGDPEEAIKKLIALDRDKQILSRDITMIDLRLADRVTVRLSDDAAAAREEAFKDKKTKRKGGDA
jgi:cell division protein FtsQ